MDKILHRGKYAVKEEEEQLEHRVAEHKPVGRFWRMIGVNSHEFSKVDKGLFLYSVFMSAFHIVCFIVLVVLYAIGFMNDDRWMFYWRIEIVIILVTGSIGAIWISIGGLFDLRKMYSRLAVIQRNDLDDGRVSGSRNLADEAMSVSDDDSIKEK